MIFKEANPVQGATALRAALLAEAISKAITRCLMEQNFWWMLSISAVNISVQLGHRTPPLPIAMSTPTTYACLAEEKTQTGSHQSAKNQ